jgi:hypothetical protein
MVREEVIIIRTGANRGIVAMATVPEHRLVVDPTEVLLPFSLPLHLARAVAVGLAWARGIPTAVSLDG